ncbi:hypothetical protein BJY01DRAFT_1483 [Aspergillus pseudoustus]|uniref:CFEM domain-containing protein n=1 Tax=Aspergillus pseudoustus TaxID=1810923 RepID=A0ABR4L525_9EURO
MKPFTLPMALLATVGAARAQLGVSNCANMCLGNMLALAGELGCDDGDLECLCETPDYSYGIRDCTTEACPDDDASAVLQVALGQCPGSSGGDVTNTPGPETTSSSESAASTTITGSDGSTTVVPVTTITGSDGSTTVVPVTTSAASTTITGSDGSTTVLW